MDKRWGKASSAVTDKPQVQRDGLQNHLGKEGSKKHVVQLDHHFDLEMKLLAHLGLCFSFGTIRAVGPTRKMLEGHLVGQVVDLALDLAVRGEKGPLKGKGEQRVRLLPHRDNYLHVDTGSVKIDHQVSMVGLWRTCF